MPQPGDRAAVCPVDLHLEQFPPVDPDRPGRVDRGHHATGQLEHRTELPILLSLLGEAEQRAGPAVLRRWVRAPGRVGRPIDALLRRDFGAFEDASTELAKRGFVLRGGG